MEKYSRCLELVSFIGREVATRSALERLNGGFFADKLSFYEKNKIIYEEKSYDRRDDKFYLTSLGLKLWRHEISVQDIKWIE